MKLAIGGLLLYLVIFALLFICVNSFLIRKELVRLNDNLEVMSKKVEEQNRILYNNRLNFLRTETY